MPLITFGNNTKLKLKIPSKGDTNWSEDFKTYFVDPIVEHDHSGINGRGKKLTADALEDGAIEAQHVNFRLRDLTDVLDAEPTSGQYLKFVNGSWQGGSVDTEESTINNAGSGAGTIGDDTSGVNLDPNAELYISDVQGGDTLDFTGREGGELVGVKVIIDSATQQDKKAKFANLTECIIISNIDIEVTGKIDKCIIIMENDEVAAGTEGCNLILSSVENGPDEVNFIVKGSKIIADTIEVNNATSIERHLFIDSEVKTQELDLQLLGGADSNKTKITRSNVDVSVKITNSNDLSSVSGAEKLRLTNSKVSFPIFEHLVNSALATYTMSNAFINVGDNSVFKQVSSNYVKIWRQSADRWNYLVSPSGTGKIIVSNNGEPSERDFTLGNVNNVDTTGQSSNKILRYNGSDWVVGPTITGSGTLDLDNSIDTSGGDLILSGGGISISSTPSGTDQILQWNGSAFVPTTLPDAVQFAERTVTLTYNLNKSSYSGGNPHYHTFSHTLTACGLSSHLSAAGISTSNITEIKLVGASTYSHTGGYSELYMQKGNDTWLACVKNLYTISNSTSLEQDGTVSGTIDTSLLPYSQYGSYTYNSASSTDSRSGTFCSTSQEVVLWTPSMSNDPLGDVRLVASEYYMNDGSATYVVKLKISAMTGPVTTSSGSLTKNTGN